MAPFEVGHELRQDADHAAAARERTVGERAHRAHRAAAVDDADAGVREHLAEPARRGAIVGMRLRLEAQ